MTWTAKERRAHEAHLEPPDDSHCPACRRPACYQEVGHCEDNTGDCHSGRALDPYCACDCDRCLRPWAARCTEAAAHRTCNRHREDD